MSLQIDNIKPVNGKVLIEIQHHAVKSKGGLFIPDAEKKRSPLGKVIRVADDVTKCAIGDLVYFDLYEGTRLDEFNIIIKDDFIYAVINKEQGDGSK